MGMMSVHHPDILWFITAKDDVTALQNFNLSVKVTDRFMADLKDRPARPHIVQNPRTGDEYVIPRTVAPRGVHAGRSGPRRAGERRLLYGLGRLGPDRLAQPPHGRTGDLFH